MKFRRNNERKAGNGSFVGNRSAAEFFALIGKIYRNCAGAFKISPAECGSATEFAGAVCYDEGNSESERLFLFMRRKLFLLVICLVCSVCSVSCIPSPDSGRTEAQNLNGQTMQQLHLPDGTESKMIAVWIPYFICDRLFEQSDEMTAKENVREYLQEMQVFGVNTVFLHVCAFGESTYPSAYYPMTPTANRLDETEIFRSVCRQLNLSLHLWINPLRLQSKEYMDLQSGSSMLTQWYQNAEKRSSALSEWNGRYYLNPAAESTRSFLTGAVQELIDRYHPDGIHIDDYFYPTEETAFDRTDFQNSGETDLSAWRRKNITQLVKSMNNAVHQANPKTVFSVSPQGNLLKNYESLYADVAEWCQTGECCDLLIPQIYFGYLNELCPFAETAAEWLALPRSEKVGMAIGLAAYKIGEEDLYAGDGQYEWVRTEEILARQAGEMLREPTACGIGLYHSDSLLALSAKEKDALIRSIKEQ